MGAEKKTYAVVVPLVIAKSEEGTDVYLYEGAPVPSSMSKDELTRLIEGEFVAESGVEPEEDQPTDPYDGKTVPDLEELVKERNEGREDDKKIAPASGKKDDLLAALKADDDTSKQ